MTRAFWPSAATLLVVLSAAPALAQNFMGGTLNPNWDSTTKFNRDACTNGTQSLEVTLQSSTDLSGLVGEEFIVYIGTTSSCAIDIPSNEHYVTSEPLESTDALVSGTTFLFPDDLDSITDFTVADVINTHFPACTFDSMVADDQEGLPLTQRYLCFAINDTINGADNNAIESTEPFGWILLQMDTRIPSAPDTPSVTPLDGKLRFSTQVSNPASDDVVEYTVRIRALPAGATAPSGDPCDTWPPAEVNEATETGTENGGTITINATNGTTYEACVFAVDVAENLGLPSEVVLATPREECDYLECLPVDEKPGYCGATGGAGIFAFSTLLVLWRRGLRRRRKFVRRRI